MNNPDFTNFPAEVEKDIDNIALKGSRFKIGKTGQTLNEKFDSEYQKEYTHIHELLSSNDAGLIERLEGHFIEKYKEHPKNDNEIEGSAGKMKPTGTYYLYVVYK